MHFKLPLVSRVFKEARSWFRSMSNIESRFTNFTLLDQTGLTRTSDTQFQKKWSKSAGAKDISSTASQSLKRKTLPTSVKSQD